MSAAPQPGPETYEGPLDAPSLDDILGILHEVWASYLGAEGELLPRVGGVAPGTDLITASVSVAGAWIGHIVVETSVAAARSIAAAMLALQEDELTDDDVTDAMGEIANVVGGNVKSTVPDLSTLSLPVVIRGGAGALAWPDAAESACAEMAWRGEPVTLTVWMGRGTSTRKDAS
ncbi:MAG: chemotaxis protein CheX [Actinomycetota bacterium]|nr:chemotaxis protein CheX [Actinomycetota bacterium]